MTRDEMIAALTEAEAHALALPANGIMRAHVLGARHGIDMVLAALRAAPTPPADPPGLVALVQRLQQAHVCVETVPDGDFAGADIADREFSDAEEALLTWTPATPPETPVEPQKDRHGNLLVRVSTTNAAGNVDTGIYAFPPPTRPETVTRAQLASIEWAGYEDYPCCPVCQRRQGFGGHNDGCWLAAALAVGQTKETP